jgi:hypothetical protein
VPKALVPSPTDEGPNVEESHGTRISSGVIGRCPNTELPSERRGEALRVRRSVASQSARSGNGAQGAAGMGPPQLCEPPYTDPYVRWWGRGVAGTTGYPLSRFCRSVAARHYFLSPDVLHGVRRSWSSRPARVARTPSSWMRITGVDSCRASQQPVSWRPHDEITATGGPSAGSHSTVRGRMQVRPGDDIRSIRGAELAGNASSQRKTSLLA